MYSRLKKWEYPFRHAVYSNCVYYLYLMLNTVIEFPLKKKKKKYVLEGAAGSY